MFTHIDRRLRGERHADGKRFGKIAVSESSHRTTRGGNVNNPSEVTRRGAVRRSFLAVLALLMTTGLMFATTAANASADVSPQWFGKEHKTIDTSTNWGGWVDGNGPDSYQAIAVCKNGSPRQGDVRWAGDRRGSFVYCSGGFAGHYFAKIYKD